MFYLKKVIYRYLYNSVHLKELMAFYVIYNVTNEHVCNDNIEMHLLICVSSFCCH